MNYNYDIGISIPEADKDKFVNVIEQDNKLYVKLGTTYNTLLKAEVGDILTIGVAEIKAEQKDDKIHLSWDNPVVRDLPQASGFIRKPDSIKEILKLAEFGRGYVKKDDEIPQNEELQNSVIIKGIEGQLDFTEKMKGQGVLQIHILGLSEQELKDLDFSKASAHIDFRLHPEGTEYWEGGEFMIGRADMFASKFKEAINSGGKLRCEFKMPQKAEEAPNQKTSIVRGPLSWMKMGETKPEIFNPGEIGSLSKTYAMLIMLEKFDWVAGKQIDAKGNPHYKEFLIDSTWLNNSELKKLGWDSKVAPISGRWIFTYVPIAEGQRIWMASRPVGGQMTKEAIFIKKDTLRHEVTGIVYEPFSLDSDGDYCEPEDIFQAQRSFVLDADSIIYFHHEKQVDAKVMENWLSPIDFFVKDDMGQDQEIKAGTWLLTVKVLDPLIWEKIESGEIRGFSMRGIAEG